MSASDLIVIACLLVTAPFCACCLPRRDAHNSPSIRTAMTVSTKSAAGEYPTMRIAPVRLLIWVTDHGLRVGHRLVGPLHVDVDRVGVAVRSGADVFDPCLRPAHLHLR